MSGIAGRCFYSVIYKLQKNLLVKVMVWRVPSGLAVKHVIELLPRPGLASFFHLERR
jgi:hypothetical protein